MPALGGPPRRIVADSGLRPATRPRWSSDGKRAGLRGPRCRHRRRRWWSPGHRRIRRISLPGRSVNTRLDLAWSSDGRYFAYVDTKDHSSQVGRILVIGAEGGTPSEITDERTKVASPTWSRDGRDLYYVSNRGGSMDLWRQGMRSGQPVGAPQPMTTGVGVTSASFSPDGRHLAYSKGGVMANGVACAAPSGSPGASVDAQQADLR